MGFWVFVALAIAVLALRRVLRLEGAVRELRGEIVTLQARLAKATRQAGEATPDPAPARTTAAPAADLPAEAPLVTFDEPTGEGAAPAAASVTAPPSSEAPASEPVPPPLPAAPAAAAASALERDADSIERQIGSRWLLYVGVAALVLGVSYFIKFAFDNEWIAPPLRVVLGLAGGAALMWAGQLFVNRGLERYGQTLTGGGVGILYLAIYAAHHWYGLVGRGSAFAAMVIATLAGVWAADRQHSQVLALFAVTTGFLTPFLVGGQPVSPNTLFTYDLILIAGTLLLARRRDWPALNIVSYMATAMTVSAWAERAYRRSDYLVTELFLTAFLALFLLVWRENRKSTKPMASLATVVLASAPILYHFASLAVLGPHRGPLLVYFILASVAGVIAGQHLRTAWLRVAVWIAIAAPFLGFASTRLGRGWLVAAWVTLAAIYGLHVIAQVQALDDERDRVPVPEVFLLHANALWALAAIWLLLAPRSIEGLAPVTFAFALGYGALAYAGRRWHRGAALHGAALAMTFAAAACAMRFSAPWLCAAFGVEGAALVWLGLRERRHWLRHAGSFVLSFAVAFLLVLLARPLGLDDWPFLNTRAAAAAALVLLMYASAHWSRTLASPPGSLGFPVARLVVLANVLTVLALSAEISAWFGWSAWGDPSGRPPSASWTAAELARQLTLSIVWAAYAVVLVAVGLWRDYRPVRVLAIALFAVTIGKVFFVDLAQLDRVSRMFSVMALGLLLLTASYMYQRLRSAPAPGQPATAPQPDAHVDTPVEHPES